MFESHASSLPFAVALGKMKFETCVVVFFRKENGNVQNVIFIFICLSSTTVMGHTPIDPPL